MLTRLLRSLLARDGIFVDDVGEIALFEAMPRPPGRCRSRLTLRTSAFEITTLPARRRPLARGAHLQRLVDGGNEKQPERGEQHRVDEPRQIRQHGFPPETASAIRRDAAAGGSTVAGAIYLARVSASQMPPPIMKPPETRDSSRVRCSEKNSRARPASSA